MTNERENHDLVSAPLPFMLAWGFPIAILTSMNFAHGYIPFKLIILIMAGTFMWMGLACLLNARRCRRRHCYYSGPIFLAGAAGILIVGFEIISLGRDGLNHVVWGTFGFVILTFVSELFWGKYVTPKSGA